MLQNRISFVGAGRVANALCTEMYKAGFDIRQIVSKTEKSCARLADSCKASWSLELNFTKHTDVIIVAVPDHQLKSALECVPAWDIR
jgi:3-hydroxyisobutyrate dehydrogenase-like beta-hydroxyacid dehydrogenase